MRRLICRTAFLFVLTGLWPLFGQEPDSLLAAGRLLRVDIRMPAEDWHALRISHRTTGENLSEVTEKAYDYYKAYSLQTAERILAAYQQSVAILQGRPRFAIHGAMNGGR